MKKIFLLVFFAPLLGFAYNNTDIDTAHFLAGDGIINEQTDIKKYRLDDTITRAEVVGMALKIQGITLPDDYFCKNYFTDVKYDSKNNWKCRAVELAADNGLITKANAKFRPSDTVTRVEALAIIMKAGNIVTQTYVSGALMDDVGIWDENLTAQVSIAWQRNIFYTYLKEVSKTYLSGTQFVRSDANSIVIKGIRPNTPATRTEVFGFAGSILGYTAPQKNDTLTIENNNVVWYQNGIRKKTLTSDGNDVLGAHSICESPAEFNSYTILGQAGGFFIVSHVRGLCETDSSTDDILIFDGNALVDLRAKIRQEFDISLGYGVNGSVSVVNNQVLVSGSFSYKDGCVDLGCPVYLSHDTISSLEIRVLKEPKGDVPGEFQFYFDPAILF